MKDTPKGYVTESQDKLLVLKENPVAHESIMCHVSLGSELARAECPTSVTNA